MQNNFPEQLSIKQLIRQINRELQASQEERESEGDPALFAIDQLTIEVNFVVTESKDLKGGIDLQIVSVGAGRQYVQQQVHKITLSLKAAKPGSGDMQNLEGYDPFGSLPREGD